MPYITWTEDMGEISGFGGGYESACRDMVKAGVELMESKGPYFEPKFKGFKNVYGLVLEDNDDAKELSAAMLAVVDGASGAMHQAAVSHALAFCKLGADEYCRQLREQAKASS